MIMFFYTLLPVVIVLVSNVYMQFLLVFFNLSYGLVNRTLSHICVRLYLQMFY